MARQEGDDDAPQEGDDDDDASQEQCDGVVDQKGGVAGVALDEDEKSVYGFCFFFCLWVLFFLLFMGFVFSFVYGFLCSVVRAVCFFSVVTAHVA